ncbi:olfactomedin-like protein 2A [Amia ocellicauda]|uniref:olfactomedin-like protein 2A n=1 Tax=Amia ocellicauda TaxID=2972642 RepID=UPI0034643395
MQVSLCVATLSLLALTLDTSTAKPSALKSKPHGTNEGQCGCRCLLRRPSLEQCMLGTEQGEWKHNPSLIQPLPSWGSKCKCHCEITGYSPCENELKLDRLRNKIPDITKIQSTVKILQQALENSDIRRLSSNTNRVITHIKTLDQVLQTNEVVDKSLLKKLQGSLLHNALLYQNFSEAIRSLSREVYKLNGHLRHTVATQPSKDITDHTGDVHNNVISHQNSLPLVDNNTNPSTETHHSQIVNATMTHPNQLTNVSQESHSMHHGNQKGEHIQDISIHGVKHVESFTTPFPTPYDRVKTTAYNKSPPLVQQEFSNGVHKNNCSGTLISVEFPQIVAHFGSKEGAWFSDPIFPDGTIYVADRIFGSILLEFKDLKALRQDNPSSPHHSLPCSYSGTGHTVYNGSFYYLKAFTQTLIRYSLAQRALAAWTQLHDLSIPTRSGSGVDWQGHNDVTLGADEAGLWAAYPSTHFGAILEDELVMIRLDPVELLPLKDSYWKTGLQRSQYGLYFLSCGVLYCLYQDALHYAFDTHTQAQSRISLSFPARSDSTHLTQLYYCPWRRALFGWDNATQISYSLLFTQ